MFEQDHANHSPATHVCAFPWQHGNIDKFSMSPVTNRIREEVATISVLFWLKREHSETCNTVRIFCVAPARHDGALALL